MRNLIIKREESSAGANRVYHVYIEDYAIPKLKINGVPCRKLGTLKNGEIATFRIADREAKVFVIANVLTRGYSNDCYQIEEGQNDVFLTGRCEKNFWKLDPFRFDGNDSPEIEEFRRKVRKKRMTVFLAAASICLMIGYLSSMKVFESWIDPSRDIYTTPHWEENADEKEFSVVGMKITLDENFSAVSDNYYTVIYDSQKVTVFVLQETYAKYPSFEEISCEEYVQKIIEANEIEDAEIENKDDLYYFISKRINSDNESHTYYSFVFKTDDSFWFFQFVVKTEEAKALEDSVFEWANTVNVE